MDYSELLHDDELVLVLLPVAALLQARAVCRRWRALALDAHVWRHRDLSVHSILESKPALVALRLAPRLRSLTISSAYLSISRPGFEEAALHTDCAVSELNLRFRGSYQSSNDDHWTEQVLQRQVELGASGVLRRVALRQVDPTRAVFVVGLALRANLDELELELELRLEPETRGPSWSAMLSDEAALGFATLKALRFDSRSDPSLPDPPLVLQPLLRAHAATLEFLAVQSTWYGGDEGLLARCTRLRRLELSACAANARALADTQITDLTLTDPFTTQNYDLESFVPFLQSATQLRRLSLCEVNVSLATQRVLTKLGSSCLEELSVYRLGDVSLASLLDIVSIGLPQLRSLSVVYTVFEDALLAGARTAVLPSLQELRVKMIVCTSDAYHDNNWMQVDSMGCGLPGLHDLVRHNPQLHVLGLPSESICSMMHHFFPKRVCGCCKQGLHPKALEGHYSLYGHEEGGQCGLPAHRAQSGKCPCKPHCDLPHTWVRVI